MKQISSNYLSIIIALVIFLISNKSLILIDKKYCISKNEQKYLFEGLTTNQKLILLSETKKLPSHYYDVIWKNKQKFSTELFNKITINKSNNLIKYTKLNSKKVVIIDDI